MKITIESKWNTSSVEFKNSDVSLEQVFEAIKGLLVIGTWSESSIDDYIIELAESIKGFRADVVDKSKVDIDNRFIYLITNETDRIVESAWSNFEEAKKECKKLENMKPQKQFMVVEMPILGD